MQNLILDRTRCARDVARMTGIPVYEITAARNAAEAKAADIAELIEAGARIEPRNATAPRFTYVPGAIHKRGKGYRARVCMLKDGKLWGQKTGARFWASRELAEAQARIAALSVARDYAGQFQMTVR